MIDPKEGKVVFALPQMLLACESRCICSQTDTFKPSKGKSGAATGQAAAPKRIIAKSEKEYLV